MRDNINVTKKSTGPLIGTSKEGEPQVRIEKATYVLMSRHQNAGQSHDITANRASKNVPEFKYLGNKPTNYSLIYEEINSDLIRILLI